MQRGRDVIRANLEKLVANQDFVAANCSVDAERGVHRLYQDPDLGFVVLAHIYEKGVESPTVDASAWLPAAAPRLWSHA